MNSTRWLWPKTFPVPFSDRGLTQPVQRLGGGQDVRIAGDPGRREPARAGIALTQKRRVGEVGRPRGFVGGHVSRGHLEAVLVNQRVELLRRKPVEVVGLDVAEPELAEVPEHVLQSFSGGRAGCRRVARHRRVAVQVSAEVAAERPQLNGDLARRHRAPLVQLASGLLGFCISPPIPCPGAPAPDRPRSPTATPSWRRA